MKPNDSQRIEIEIEIEIEIAKNIFRVVTPYTIIKKENIKMTISFKGGFTYNLKDSAVSANRDLKQGLDTKALSNLTDFKKYTPNSFELNIELQSRPYYKGNMDYLERERYNSLIKRFDKENGKLTITDKTSGDKFIVSSNVTNEDNTVNPDKFQNALNELTIDRIKKLSTNFNEKITECEDKAKKELSKNALNTLFYGD